MNCKKLFNPFSGHFDFVSNSETPEQHTHTTADVQGLDTKLENIEANINMLADIETPEYEFAVGNKTNPKCTESKNTTTYINLIERNPRRNIVDLIDTRGRVKITGKNGIDISSVDNSLSIDAKELKEELMDKATINYADSLLGTALDTLQPQITNNATQLANHESRISTLENDTPEAPIFVVPILYNELKLLRDNAQLTAGVWYRITDYECTTLQENTTAANNIFDILVLALTNNTLSENARATHHDHDSYFANSKLQAWELKYCIDNDQNRFKWAVNSVLNRFIKIKRNDNTIIENAFFWNGNGDNYISWWDRRTLSGLPRTYYYTEFSETPTAGMVVYSDEELTNPIGTIENYIVIEIGKGVIYHLCDEFGNSAPYDFKNMLFDRNTDYGTMQMYTFNTFHDLQSGEMYDSTMQNMAYNNKISPRYEPYFPENPEAHGNCLILNNIVVNTQNMIAGTTTNGNIFELGCYNITLGITSSYNIFGVGCHDLKLGDNFQYNTFGVQNSGHMIHFDGMKYCKFGDFLRDLDIHIEGDDGLGIVSNVEIQSGLLGIVLNLERSNYQCNSEKTIVKRSTEHIIEI